MSLIYGQPQKLNTIPKPNSRLEPRHSEEHGFVSDNVKKHCKKCPKFANELR